MNRRRPKIWHSEDQIIACIDRTRRMAASRLKKSQELDEAAKIKFGKCEELRFKLMGNNLGAMEREQMQARLGSYELSAAETKEKADIAARAYHRALEKTLPRLGEILAAFRTEPMKGIVGEYRGVCVK